MSVARPANGPIRSASALSTAGPTKAPDSRDTLSAGPASLDLTPGSAQLALGTPRIVRIPIPGAKGLFLELTPRGWTPKGGSTSTLFIQTVSGDRHLRLDYGYNVKTQTIDYHWNVRKAASIFGVSDHTAASAFDRASYRGAKYFNHAGAVMIALGAVADLNSIVVARRRWRQALQVSAGWLGAWQGCRYVGRLGAAAGRFFSPAGMMIGGILGCAAGACCGDALSAAATGQVYDLVEELYYEPLPQVQPPRHTTEAARHNAENWR